jgi:hypothetical protein
VRLGTSYKAISFPSLYIDCMFLVLIRMTAIAALMRNLGEHSSLADITLIWNLISIHHLLPLPPDTIITPARFEVKRRRHDGPDDDETDGHVTGGETSKGFLE